MIGSLARVIEEQHSREMVGYWHTFEICENSNMIIDSQLVHTQHSYHQYRYIYMTAAKQGSSDD